MFGWGLLTICSSRAGVIRRGLIGGFTVTLTQKALKSHKIMGKEDNRNENTWFSIYKKHNETEVGQKLRNI